MGIRVDPSTSGKRSDQINVSGMKVEYSTFRGILADADHLNVQNSLFYETGGTRLYDNAYAVGIETSGHFCTVHGNSIEETYAAEAGESVGISLSNPATSDCTVSNNLIRNRRTSKFGRSFGVWSANRSPVTDNLIENQSYGIVQGAKKEGESARRDNVIVDEHCSNEFYSKDIDNGLDRFVKTSKATLCPDLEHVINEIKQTNKKIYFFRMGQLLAMKDRLMDATSNFVASEMLGSTEAGRLAQKNLTLGLISPDQFEAARRSGERMAEEANR